MKIVQMKVLALMVMILLVVSCGDSKTQQDVSYLLPSSSGSNNQILTVIKASYWDGEIGNEIRKVFGEHQVGLLQRETLVSMSQVPISSFNKTTNTSRSILHISIGDKDTVTISKDKYSKPQAIVYIKARSQKKLKYLIASRAKDIIKVFKDHDLSININKFRSSKLDETKFKTIKDLGISIAIPNSYRLVKDSVGFLWLRQRLSTSIKLNGSNNVTVYSVPFANANLPDSIVQVRDQMSKRHLQGSSKDNYMVTEKALAPAMFDSTIDGKIAFETRGLWYMKDDIMGGAFINYAIKDESKKRYIVFEGFVYMPSFPKRDLIFELEAIAKSISFND